MKFRQAISFGSKPNSWFNDLLVPEPYGTMVVVAQCLGLRVSEILVLQWRDINFGEPRMPVNRGVVDGVVDEVKTEYSEDDLPLDPDLATILLNWKERCPESEEGWVFPSPITGRCYHASPIQPEYIRPAGRKLDWVTSGGIRLGTRTASGSIQSALRCAAEADAARPD